MTITDAPNPGRISAYNCSAPTEADALAALGRVFGAQRGSEIWARACRASGLAPGAVGNPALMERCAQTLANEGGAAATVARSVTIRLRTYNRLAARSPTPAMEARA